MKTISYNPSPIEKELAKALTELQNEIGSRLKDNEIIGVESNLTDDNPLVKLNLKDNDGDQHEVIIRIIQLPDK